jgi:hypothetical protein
MKVLREQAPRDPERRDPHMLPALQSATCRCCGAVLPAHPIATRLDQVPRNEHVKRAIEVALAGPFSLAITGAGASHSEALALAQVARGYGLTAFCLLPCPCGNFGDSERACTCSPRLIARMRATRRYQIALQADLHVVAFTSQEARLGKVRPGEPDEQVLARVTEAQARPRPALTDRDAAAESLMRAAMRQLDLRTADVERLWQVAAAIAQLSTQPRIGAAHLAEALQYRPREPAPRRPVM